MRVGPWPGKYMRSTMAGVEVHDLGRVACRPARAKTQVQMICESIPSYGVGRLMEPFAVMVNEPVGSLTQSDWKRPATR